jgi:hypothetical protein
LAWGVSALASETGEVVRCIADGEIHSEVGKVRLPANNGRYVTTIPYVLRVKRFIALQDET